MLHYKAYTSNYHPAEVMAPSVFDSVSTMFSPKSAQQQVGNKRIILTLDCGKELNRLIRKSLPGQADQYEILDTRDLRVSYNAVKELNTQLLIVSIDKCTTKSVELVKNLKNNPLISELPLIIFSKERPTLEELDELMAVGTLDCLSLSIDRMELLARMKANLMHAQILNQYKHREAELKAERDQLASHFENLKGEMDSKQRESLAHLELLLRSKKVNETLMDKIHDLRPFLNTQGKTKLSFITKQMKWELDEEEEMGLQRKHDESNYDLYKRLEDKRAGLTKYEMRLCAYLKANQSAADIARIIKKSANCINVAFARIRAKLSVANNVELRAMLEGMEMMSV